MGEGGVSMRGLTPVKEPKMNHDSGGKAVVEPPEFVTKDQRKPWTCKS